MKGFTPTLKGEVKESFRGEAYEGGSGWEEKPNLTRGWAGWEAAGLGCF